MPFNIPNAADAEDPTQAQADSRDFGDILVAAFAGTGVVSGCAVTAQGSPNMTVAVAAGTVAVAGATVAVTGGNVTITTANATNPRFDLICADNTGVKSAVAGTAAANPVFPSPAGKVVLAAVRVPAAVASINAAKITDKRVAPVVVPQAVPTGALQSYVGGVAPAGWQLCDGSAISRATYSILFALIGTAYGVGDGSTTFNVPDLRGRIPVGLGTNADVNALAKSDGLAVANRSPLHNSTSGLSFSAAAGNTGAVSNDHTHPVNGGTGGQSVDHSHVEHGVAHDVAISGGGIQTFYMIDGYNVNGVATGGVSTDHSHAVNIQSGGISANHTHAFTSGGSILGGIGPGGSRPTDTPGFVVVNYIIKL